MTDLTLHYWPIPFRGQFVRVVLAHIGADWTEAAPEDVAALMEADPADQPIPCMAPPVLVDHRDGLALSQTQAILTWLGERHGLIPDDPAGRALTAKVIADANDVLFETTRHNGAQMWTAEAWAEYRPRLARWMALFEALRRRSGPGGDGWLLGTPEPAIADLAAYALWGVMTERLPALRPMLDEAAPDVAALCDRVAARSEQAALRARCAADWGDAWCGGEIEASLRAVL